MGMGSYKLLSYLSQLYNQLTDEVYDRYRDIIWKNLRAWLIARKVSPVNIFVLSIMHGWWTRSDS